MFNIVNELSERMHIEIENDNVFITEEDGCFYLPRDINSLIDKFAMFIDEDEYTNIKNGNFDEATATPIQKAIYQLLNCKKELTQTIERVEVTCSSYGYGGDDDSRYYEDSYTKKELKELKKEIAEENGVSVEDVTEEMFCDFVGDKSSNLSYTYEYNKKTGKSKRTRSMTLE